MSNHYVDRLDEITLEPPYTLGTKKAPFQGCTFFLQGSEKKLRKLTDRFLNEPFRGHAPVRFAPGLLNQVQVAFFKYGLARSDAQPEEGWLSYVEVLVGHDVLIHDGSDTADPGFHLAFVYIGPATPEDSGAFPIVLGRESFGFAKNPGRIDFEVDGSGHLTKAALDVWDYDNDDQKGRLLPKPAIRIEPSDPGGRKAKRAEGDAEDAFHETAIRAFVGDAVDLSHRPWKGLAHGETFHVETPGLALDPNGQHVVNRIRFTAGNTMLKDLVALKQFRDAAIPELASYQGVVRTRLRGPVEKFRRCDGVVDFADLNRVKMWKEMGVPQRGAPVTGFYQEGCLTYADPRYTKTWTVPPIDPSSQRSARRRGRSLPTVPGPPPAP